MADDPDLSRREFMQVGTTSLLAMSAGGQLQVNAPDDPDEYQFQGVADLMGPAAAKPTPTDPFFDNKIAYAYRYQETDANQYEWFITDDDTHWTNLSMPLTDYTTPYNALKTAQQFSQFALDPSKGPTRRRYSWFSNNTLFDKTHVTENDANGTIDLSTAGTGANTARMHSAISGQYLSHSLAQPGLGLDIADANVNHNNGLVELSHGSIAAGVGWHDKSAGGWGVGGPIQTFLGIRYTSSGAEATLIANGSHIGDSPVSQSDWNMDTMDGSNDADNPSGLKLEPQKGYVYQFPYTWYGHGALFVGVSHPKTDEVIRFHKFNIPETSFDRPNMPPLVVLDDDGSAADLTAQLGGMQYALYGSQLGEEGTEERGTEITRTNFSVGTQSVDSNGSVDPISEPGDPIFSFRRTSGVRDLALRLDSLFAEVDNPIWVFSWDEYDPATALTNQNFRNPNESVHPSDETLVEIDTAATDYSPTTAVSRGIDFIYTDKNSESLQQLSTDDRVPIDATRVITAAHEGTSATVDPAQVRIVEGY